MEKIIYLSKKLKAFTFDEIFLLAEMEKAVLGMSERTVQRDWEKARIYLHGVLRG